MTQCNQMGPVKRKREAEEELGVVQRVRLGPASLASQTEGENKRPGRRGRPPEAGRPENRFFPKASRKKHGAAATLVLAQQELLNTFRISKVLNCRILNLCCFKPLDLRRLVKEDTGN